MKPKKTKNADLENKKGVFLQLGLIVALSLILIAFEWTSVPKEKSDFTQKTTIAMESDVVVTRREEPKVEPVKKDLPPVYEVLDIVDDDVPLPDVDFSSEVGPNTDIDFGQWVDIGDEVIDDDTPFVVVEDMPTFNNGDPKIEFRKYISKNVIYPAIAIEHDITGIVYVQFIVNEQGRIQDAVILGSVDPSLDQEALRVVNASPVWTPGKQRGKAVKVIYTFPIKFQLQ